MDLIKTGIGLTKTIKNVSRLREIVAVLARNGLDELVVKSGLHSKIPGFVLPKSRFKKIERAEQAGATGWWDVIGFRLRKSFEELGPGFIKIGQLLSTREDLFDPAFIYQMKMLRDKVEGVPFANSKDSIENAFGKKINEIFSFINEQPIGTASIGVVYKGTLQNGDQVVVKVRRPGIEKSIEVDFDILFFLITQFEKVSDEIKFLGISRLIKDFEVTIKTELDFRTEMRNCEKLKENISAIDTEKVFYLPKVYPALTSENVMVMEFIEGIPFTNAVEINQHYETLKGKLDNGIGIFIRTLLSDGLFHADLHGGNFFYLKNGQIGIIDFGLVGNISKKNRINLIAILYALITHNYDNLTYEFLEVAEFDTVPEVQELIRDIRDGLTPFVGLTVQQMNVSVLFRTIIKVLSKHQIYLPREWFIIFRALIVLDGVGKSLNMDFDIFGIIEKDIRTIIKSFVTFESVAEDAVWSARDLLASARVLPRHIRWFLKEAAKKKYALEIINKGYNDEFKFLANSIIFAGFSFFAAILSLCGTLLIQDHEITTLRSVPSTAWIFYGLAFILFLRGFISIKIKRK